MIPVDADGLYKDTYKKLIEQSLRRDFDTSASLLWASIVRSFFPRTAYILTSALLVVDIIIPKELKDELKRIVLATTVADNASLDTL